jgi:GTPase SAR1 family protein
MSNKDQKWINAFIFVYDASDQNSFKKLLKIIQSVIEFERSNALGLKLADEEQAPKVMKYVLGTKKDLKSKKKVLEEEDLRAL